MTSSRVVSDAMRQMTGAIGEPETDRPATPPAPHEHLDVIDNVLRDTSTPDQTRRWLLKRAAGGAALAGALGLMDPIGTAFAATKSGADTPQMVGTIAVTAETFAVTYLGAVLEKDAGVMPALVKDVIRAADVEEFYHRKFLVEAGFKPLTHDFYLPKALFGPTVKHVAAVIEIAETLFVNAYLIGITVFSAAGSPKLARYAGEILGVEAEHRTLARFVQGKLPNNVAFESYRFHRLDEIVGQLEDAGVGFGKPTKKGGNKFRYHGLGNNGRGVNIKDHKPS
ncbi:MAG: hypothetical protein ACRDMJ_04305 [Solirubrobacteraceae bacterium]